MSVTPTRRRFLANAAMAGGAFLLRAPPAVAEEELETTSLRFIKTGSICSAPQDVAEELLRAEGFTDIRYLALPSQSFQEKLVSGELDLGLEYASKYVVAIDRGLPVTMLAGAHVGCFELFGNENVRSIIDLKGKRVGIPGFGSPYHLFIVLIAAQVGLDPKKDIDCVVASSSVESMQLFVDGKTDAFFGLPTPTAGAAGPACRTCHRRQRPRPSLVGVFLLHAGRQPGIRAEMSRRDQTRGARHLQSRRSLRHRPRPCRAAARRGRIHPEIRLCPSGVEQAALRQMARIRSRGHCPLLCPPPARGRADQVEPAEDHRRRHRLAFPRRAQTRAEGVRESISDANKTNAKAVSGHDFTGRYRRLTAHALCGGGRAARDEVGTLAQGTIHLRRSARCCRRVAACRRIQRYPPRAARA